MTTEVQAEPAPGWTPDDSSFGARLALVRQRMGWGNVKTAAQACGLPVESWRTWERDNVEPRRLVGIARSIAEQTGCDYLWLLLGPGRGRRITAGYRPPTVQTSRPPTRGDRTRPSGPQARPPGRGARPAALLRSVASR